MTREVQHDGKGHFQIRFPYDRELVELIKTLPRRRWNAAGRVWLVPDEHLLLLVELLQPRGFSFDEVSQRGYRMLGGELEIDAPPVAPEQTLPGLAAPRSVEDEFSVSSLNECVKSLLEGAFPRPVWLIGEISGFNRSAHKRHVGFQLDEKDASGSTLSSIQATLFERTRAELESKLRSAGDPFRLEDELTVRLRVSVGLYVPWGAYRVVVEDIDLEYTLGEAARRREEILRTLAEEGLLGANAALPIPEVPLRVGLITSLNSDAYNDVVRTLEESAFGFDLTAHGARVQGPATVASTLNALERLAEDSERLDVVLICRGGGARTDLAWFDSEKLGRAVAAYPIPIVVGIGHEKDRSVLDEVGRRAKTPTAAAALLVERVNQFLEGVERGGAGVMASGGRLLDIELNHGRERAQRLRGATRARLAHEELRLAHGRQRLARAARHRLATDAERITRLMRDIPRAAELSIAAQRSRLEQSRHSLAMDSGRELSGSRREIETRLQRLLPAARRHLEREAVLDRARARRLQSLDPRRVLGRGYAILRDATGALLTDARKASSGDEVQAQLRQGRLKLIVDGSKSRRRQS